MKYFELARFEFGVRDFRYPPKLFSNKSYAMYTGCKMLKIISAPLNI